MRPDVFFSDTDETAEAESEVSVDELDAIEDNESSIGDAGRGGPTTV